MACTEEDLKKAIMLKIGLGFEPGWYEGGSAALSRMTAAARLPDVIYDMFDRGEKISPPDQGLMLFVEHAARFGERSDTTLARTYMIILKVIELHIRGAEELFLTIRTSDIEDINREVDGDIEKEQRRREGTEEPLLPE